MFFFKKSSSPSSTPVSPAAMIPTPTPPQPAPVVPPPVMAAIAAPVVEPLSAPLSRVAESYAESAVATSAPRGFAPPAGRPLQRQVQRLRKQLRATSYALAKKRRFTYVPATVAEPEPILSEQPALPVVLPPVQASRPAEVPAPEPVPAPDTRLVEMQYEVLDLRHKLEALANNPVLDAAAVTALASKAPAFTEVQYEVADLRHQVQALQAEIAALKSTPSPIFKASELAIIDDQGRTVASIARDGVVSCSSVVLRSAV